MRCIVHFIGFMCRQGTSRGLATQQWMLCPGILAHWQRDRGLYIEVLCYGQEALPGLLCPVQPSALATEGSYSIEICCIFGIVRSVSPNCSVIFKCYLSYPDCQWHVRPGVGFICPT